MKKSKGITLIALVITIIVLLILAGITMTLVMGENGLIARAQQAGKNYSEAENKENTDLAKLDNEMGEYTTSSTREDGTSSGIAYSLEETKTADTWMGKPIYTKTVYIPSLPNATTTQYSHEIQNVEKIWTAENSFIEESGGWIDTVPMTHLSNVAGSISCGVNTTKIYIGTGNMNRSAFSAYITVKYTKTTDTVQQ